MISGSLKRGFTARQAEVAEFRVLRVPWFVFPLGGWGIGILFLLSECFCLLATSQFGGQRVEKEAERLRKDGNWHHLSSVTSEQYNLLQLWRGEGWWQVVEWVINNAYFTCQSWKTKQGLLSNLWKSTRQERLVAQYPACFSYVWQQPLLLGESIALAQINQKGTRRKGTNQRKAS